MERPALRGRSNPTNRSRTLNVIERTFSRLLDALGIVNVSPLHVVAEYVPLLDGVERARRLTLEGGFPDKD
jgi:hypothetical protein